MASPDAPLSSVRIYVHLRGADLAVSAGMRPSEIWYFLRHPDLPPADELPDWCVKVNVFSAARRIFTNSPRSIEIPEPLWARFLPTALLLLFVSRVARFFTGTPRLTVSYALENNEAAQALFGNSSVPRTIRSAFVWLLGIVVTPMLDRIAFGSSGAARTYRAIRTFRVKERTTITALPSRPSARCNERRTSEPPSALFVGGLEFRKGIQHVMDAWEVVESELPEARITIIGSGPLQEPVETWAARRPQSRSYLGQVPYAQLSAHYDAGHVLIAPSVRDGRWREQIGLQLRESLARGLTVVASDETGLADWLRENGHRVVPVTQLSKELPRAVVDGLVRPLEPSAVRASLPEIDGRVAADSWLHR